MPLIDMVHKYFKYIRLHGIGSGRRQCPPARRLLVGGLLATVLVTAAAVDSAWSHPTQAQENEIKAVLLERFTHFISWPAAADTTQFFTICVFGESSLTDVLQEVYDEHRILGREVRILDCTNTGVLPACDLLFVAHSNEQDLSLLCDSASNMGALTVADTPGFGRQGVMINFYRDEDRVRFEINESAVRAAGFAMSYHLLKEARILQPSEEMP